MIADNPNDTEVNEDRTEVTPVPEDTAVIKPQGPISVSKLLTALKSALRSGDITSKQAAEMRAQVGVTKSYFTKAKPNKAKIKAKRKMVQASRRTNRKKG